MPRSEHGISAADVLNETARILEAPIETDPLRELRVVLNARLQTHAVQQDRAIRDGWLAAERFHEGAVTGLTYAIEQIDAWLAMLRLAASRAARLEEQVECRERQVRGYKGALAKAKKRAAPAQGGGNAAE